jgi:chemosensory pili system protein ChpA (sensor histidine kinase/response regulator)
MSGQVAADPAVLIWIVQEVGRSLDEATDALMRCIAEPAERPPLGAARKPLAQVRGALELAGLRGVPRVVQEIHSLLQDMDAGSATFTAGTAALCTRAFTLLRGYLSELHRGEPEQPIKLASIHQEMLAARGVQRLAELDLFYLDCRRLPPEPNVVVAADAAVAAAREQRARYQQGMLAWLRGDASGLARMREAIGRVDASQASAQARQPWWIAAGFLDLLAAPSTPHTSDAKRVCAAIDQQLRRCAEGTSQAPEELLREMLYFLSIGQSVTERIAQIKQLYGLDGMMPGLRGGLEMVDVQAVEELRGKARLLKSLWEKAVQGAEPAEPAAFRDLIGQLVQESMPFAPLAALTGILRDTAETFYANPPAAESSIAIEMATALLLLENTLTAWSESDPQLDQRVAAVAARLVAAARGETDPDAAKVNLQSEALRENDAKAIRAEVAAQVLASLGAAQTVLEACFTATGPQDLGGARKALRQVHGALAVVDQPQAALVARRCDEVIGALQDGRPASAQEQQELACVLSALYVFVERLGVGSAEFEDTMQRAQVAPRWYHDAVVDDMDDAPEAPVVEAPSAAAEPAAEEGSVDVPGDPELLAIFLEEADEVLASVAQNLALLRQRLDNAPALGTIRRSFHTLKGSGRMVSLTHLGEAAWDVERLLNDWVQHNRPATAELVEFLHAAHALQAGCVDELKRTARAHVRADALAQWADRLKRGEGGGLGEPGAPVRPPEADAGASLPQQPVAAPADPTVQIGPVRLSPSLYATYLAESAQRLAAVEGLFAELAAAPERGVPPDLKRHIHSLSGISGTAGLLDVRALAAAMERLLDLLPRDEIAVTLDPLRRAINTLAQMLGAVRVLQLPQAQPELVAELELIAELMELQRPVARPEEAAFASLADLTHVGVPIAEPPEAAARAGVPIERRHNRVDDDIDEQMLPVFLEEAAELVPQVGRDLRDWRADPSSRLIPESLKRLLHTLKGSARMVGAMAIGELTHAMETRVVNVGQLSSIPDSLFEELEASFDRITLLAEELENGTPAPGSVQPITSTTAGDSTSLPMAPLDMTLHGRTLHGRTLHTTLHARTLHGRTLITSAAAALPADQPMPAGAKAAPDTRAGRALLRVRAELVDRMVNEAGEVAIAQSRVLGEMRAMRTALKDLTDNIIRLRSQAREMEIQAESQMQSRMVQAQQTEEQFDPLEFDRFTRLQELTRFVAESINDVATVQQNLMKNVDEADAALLAQRRVARSLQDQLMGVRLVPFSSLSDRLYRVARLTAREAGKRVNVDIQGAQVELDRSVLERIAAPLEHLLRNAIVHGIEAPEVRQAAGKSETGEVAVQVRQEGNEVLVTFSDDGRGLDLARIREKAAQQGLLSADAAVSDAELAQIIFAAGFSTAAQVSQAAGRGVGLDVVRSEITDLGGRVEVSFVAERGATFLVYLPLTLAVMQALLVRSGGQLFALPTLMIENVQKVRDNQLAQLYEAGETVWQERRYPLCHLQHLLADPQHVPRLRRYNAVVLMRGGPLRVAIHVDEFVGNQEIVVKNIGAQLMRVTGIAGAAVIGNGDSVLIINPVVLGDRAGQRARPLPAATENATLHGTTLVVRTAPTVMVVDDSLTVRRITGRLLAREGYTVAEARDGVEALEKLQTAVPDVMLLDIEMPRMDGFELTRRMRGDGRFRNVPIIMITSRTADKHRTLALELGVNVYLGKPYQEEELLAHISGFVAAGVEGRH